MASSPSASSDGGIVPVVSVNSFDSPLDEILSGMNSRARKRKLDFDHGTRSKYVLVKSSNGPWYSLKNLCSSVLAKSAKKYSPRHLKDESLGSLSELGKDPVIRGVHAPIPLVCRRYLPLGSRARRRLKPIKRRYPLQARFPNKPLSPPSELSPVESESPSCPALSRRFSRSLSSVTTDKDAG